MAFKINAATPEEAALFYSNAEKDKELGCIGHLRGDFGHGGKSQSQPLEAVGHDRHCSPVYRSY